MKTPISALHHHISTQPMMSIRLLRSAYRSSRLAGKSSSGSSETTASGSTGPDSVKEETLVQHVKLKSRTPRYRISRKRKAGPSDAGAEGKAEINISTERDKAKVSNAPKVSSLKKRRGATASSKRLSSPDKSPAFNLQSDSFLDSLDKIDSNEKSSKELPATAAVNVDGSQCGETVCDNNSQQDVFGDYEDALPPTPVDDTPQGTPNLSLPFKGLTVNGNSKASKVNFKRHGFQSAKEVLDLEKSPDITRKPNTKPWGEVSNTSGETKKNPGGEGHGIKDKSKRNAKFKMAFTNTDSPKTVREFANSAASELPLPEADTSDLTSQEKLQLSSWELPQQILKNYLSKGIVSLFPWQLECLANEKVLEGRNLLYSAPTSAGKTLVAEILMIKRVLELGRKAIMILPFVSVAREKVYNLQSIFQDTGIRVEGFMGSINPPGGFKAVDVAVCTIEKANSLVNRLLEEDGLADLCTLVVDELHLIGDSHRGYLLELLLTKILYMTSVKNDSAENSLGIIGEGASWRPKRFNIQIIGMSATLPNLDVLAQWLQAELYVTDYRPVPLKQLLKIEDKLFNENLKPVRNVQIEELPVRLDGDTDNIVYLALETVLNGFSVLIFCPTKQLVEATARKLAQNFYRIGDPANKNYPEIGARLRNVVKGERIKPVLDQLKQCPGGTDDTLSNVISFGIGYHHAGLTYENRDIVETAFKLGILRVIVATSTLSAGVNLPARRVIISTPLVFNRQLLDSMTYSQMCGRAGRTGIDTEGESILICPTAFKEKGLQVFKGQIPMVKSALLGDGSGKLTSSMKRAFLEATASGIAPLTTDVKSYANCTFLFHSLDSELFQENELNMSQQDRDSTIEKCIDFLKKEDLIRIMHYEQEERPDEYMPTNLGSACLAASLSPDEGISVYRDLVKAQECFVLENELHVIYQVTPIYVCDQLKNISWHDYLQIWDRWLDASEQKVGSLVGVKEDFIIRAMTGTVSWENPNPQQRKDMSIHTRFFAALALNDLVKEKSLAFVGAKYNLSKGVLQNLQQCASTYAGMVTVFCAKLGWSNVELLLGQFQERLEFGVQRELVDLVRLDCLNGQRARILYAAGIKSVVELAAADPAQVEHILHKATPFNSTVHGGRESSIWMIGKESLTEAEAAQKIVAVARDFIQMDFGQQGNIFFAFGKNDTSPMPTEIKDLGHHDGDGNGVTNRKSDALMNTSSNGKPTRMECDDKDDGNHQSNKNDLQHSTAPLPAAVAGPSTQQSFTLQQQQDKQASPTTVPLKENCGEHLSLGILPEFDRNFDSFGDTEDCSMDFNNAEKPADAFNEAQLHDEEKDEGGGGESIALSDSVTATMKVPSDDGTNFDSEELFPDVNECAVAAPAPRNQLFPDATKPEDADGCSDGCEEEDFISTQASTLSNEHVDTDDQFEQSCLETESSSSAPADCSAFNRTDNSQSMEITVYETLVGQVNVATRIVKSADVIPESFFSGSEMLGVGMKLVSLKKPSLSIGAKVVSKNTTGSQGDSIHSLAVYNGVNTIWVLRWENESGVRVGGRNRKISSGNTKLEQLLGKINDASCAIALFESKDKIKNLVRHCGASILSKLPPGERVWDPRIAQWLWDFDDEDDGNVSKRRQIDEYVSVAEKNITHSNLPSEAIEAFFAWKVMTALKEKLVSTGLWNHFVETEMPSTLPVLLMEMNGLGLDSSQLSKLKRVLQFKSALLELKAFQLAGRQFSLASPKDIKQILYRDLGLKQLKNKGGTGKEVLLKLNHELPRLIVEWRKVTSALQKIVIPFQQERNLETGRVHGNYSQLTVTGRVVMADPSLQCIPRDFDIQIDYSPDQVDEIKNYCKLKFGTNLSTLYEQLDSNSVDAEILNNTSLISMRNAFVPCSDQFTILTADYSQLELRILAHLSGDEKLLEALNEDTDVFIEIASQWKGLPKSQITNAIRQEAKGIVYGVIYGMSTKTLSEQMEIEEREAASFITQFMSTYPGIGAFIDKAHRLCQEKGYVETITGRRRYLPLVNSPIKHEKAKANRQAVNSQIQGSAADLVKVAMNRIHSLLLLKYPKGALPVEWNKFSKARRSSVHPNSTHLKNLIFFPILNLHDELIFEVRKTHLEEVAVAVKREMESCGQLDVKLPVVIKTGDSWGSLKRWR